MTKFDARSTADEVVAAADVRDRVMLVTGANGGFGYETARALAAGGAEVWLGCRSDATGDEAKARILAAHPEAQVEVLALDLGSLASVRAAAARFSPPKLDVIICNAGVYGGGYATTEDGFERTVGVCHLGHFLLVHLLLPKLMRVVPTGEQGNAQRSGRVVMVSSGSHQSPKRLDFDRFPLEARNYADLVAYGQAKLSNILFANELQRRYGDRGVTANSLHPGTMIATSISRSSLFAKIGMVLMSPFARTIAQGAATSCYVATAAELEGVGGKYFDACAEKMPSAEARDEAVAKRVWELSLGWVGLDPAPGP